ncbi:sulfite oxidase cytochrome subunit c551/c552 [Cupriavidus taiwanensis]|uniref:Sulfite oxidase cytochrome subunit c551/c552 n=1 Tax=Cupriavidus taiwanensis TaxID=164546 RepID=A0A976A229_9BURK|nr:c-type cytochrome [Cupriavidus taiwanensis]SOY53066.1 sulfite oxidase cytochrome subunit c551/c552 [Cupriavidus taiwanensis]
MSMWVELRIAALLLAAGCAAPAWAGTGDARAALGRTATPAEVAAWDIDVRPDFKGLPRGSGTVAQGQKVWDGKCASCHGDFGESNEVFTPLVGGTTAEDIRRGRVAGMTGNQPYRTTLMKVSTVSTLWDYIHRAMPWNAPKSLSVNEVYAVTAYLLHLGEIVPADFALSDTNIAEVQRRMPNRAGMTTEHGLWPGRGQPDTRNTACMSRCAEQVTIASSMPDYARDAHGDLAQQQRGFGPVRGIAAAATARPAGAAVAAAAAPAPGARLASQYQCVACHAMDRKLVGPSFADIAGKYKGQDAHAALARKVKAGGQGAWGAVPMPPQPQIPDSDVQAMVGWILEAK